MLMRPSMHLDDGDGGGVLGRVTLPRQPGVQAAEGFAVPAGEFEQPGDALGDGPVGNRFMSPSDLLCRA